MTREQIERASVTMKESQNYHMSFEDAQDYISKCGFDIPWNDGDVFVDEREITRTVGNVLKWRINSVWHDMKKEVPQVYGEYKNEVAPSIPCLVRGYLSTGYGYGVRYWNVSYEVWDDDECLYYYCEDCNLVEHRKKVIGYDGIDELIDAAYSMLCWAIDNGYIETNKNE